MRNGGGALSRLMDRRWGEAEASYHAKILDSLDPDPSAIVLDVGCDDGAWTDELRRRIFVPPDQVHGLELVD
jgi:trans-aconitate methyltransferase